MTILTTAEVTKLTRMSRTTIWKMRRAGTFPAPSRIAGKIVWREADVLAWREAELEATRLRY